MSQYMLSIVWPLACMCLFRIQDFGYIEIRGKVYKQYIPAFISLLVSIPFIYWAAVRPSGVFDTGMYAISFLDMPDVFSEIPAYLRDVEKDKGFFAVSCAIKSVIGAKTELYFGLFAFLQIVLLFHFIRKYSCDYLLSIFIFVASSDYLSWVHNGMRQFTAVTIILAATGFWLEKKYVRLFAVILIASLFHQSALLMIPIVLIADGGPWNLRTLGMLVALIVAIRFIGQFTTILDSMLTDTQYTNVVSDWTAWEDNGTNPLRVLVYSMPTILSVIGYKYIKEANDRMINICVNLSIVSTALYILSVFTSGIFIGRLPIYASLYATCILLPWEIKAVFTDKSAKLIIVALVFSYLAFYYFQCHFIWGLI